MSDTPDTTTRHEYTDAEILEAWSKSGPPIMGEPTMIALFRNFLAALPERPQPWPSQQEAIDAAFLKADQTWICAHQESPDWTIYSGDRLAIAQAYDAARPQADEIAALKAELDHLEERDRQGRAELVQLRTELLEARKSADHWHSEAELLRAEEAKAQAELAKWHAELSAVMPADFKDWHQNSPDEWPIVAAQVIRNLRAREESALGTEKKAQAELPERPQAAEIASLKDALAESEKQFQSKVDEIARLLDECDKAQGILKSCLSVMPFGNIKTHTFENLPGRIADLASEIASLSLENERLEAKLAALRQPTQSAQPLLADDGRSLIDIYGDAFDVARVKRQLPMKECCDSGFKAVASVVLAQAVRRMEAVPWRELKYVDYEAARDIFIAAAKGEGQAQEPERPQASEADKALADLACRLANIAYDPMQPMAFAKAVADHVEDLREDINHAQQVSLAEAKAEPSQPWTPENAKAFEDFQAELRETWEAHPWTPAVGDVVRPTPEMALGGQMYWRDIAIQLARVWWKCHGIGASLQHGDLDKDIAFSIVCERHGGRVFHGDTPENAWHKAEMWLMSPDRENFPAACLSPAKP